MAPIVGAAMFWRTLARDLVTLLPFAAGVVPKVAIAFAGTYAVGRAAQLYYVEGQKASPERMREFYRDALRVLRERPVGLPERARMLRERHQARDQQLIEADYQVSESSAGIP
jgi:hypothetical protein